MLKKFFEADNAIVNCFDSQGFTPLHYAASNNAAAAAQFLIEIGADINNSSVSLYDHVTPIYLATRTGSVDVFKILIGNNAVYTLTSDKNTRCSGKELLSAAKSSNNAELLTIIQSPEKIVEIRHHKEREKKEKEAKLALILENINLVSLRLIAYICISRSAFDIDDLLAVSRK